MPIGLSTVWACVNHFRETDELRERIYKTKTYVDSVFEFVGLSSFLVEHIAVSSSETYRVSEVVI